MKDDPRALGVYIAVLIEALSGIDYAHNLVDYQGQPLGIVHRDILPAQHLHHVLFGEVKVVDFGIAKARTTSGSAPTQIGTVKGKLMRTWRTRTGARGSASTRARTSSRAASIL